MIRLQNSDMLGKICAMSKHLSELAEKFGLDVVILFGSRARGHEHKESDTDIAVKASGELPFDRLLELGRNFDDFFKDTQVVDLSTAPPLLCGAVAKDGKVLYERKPSLGNQVKIWAMNQYLDYEPYLRKMRTT